MRVFDDSGVNEIDCSIRIIENELDNLYNEFDDPTPVINDHYDEIHNQLRFLMECDKELRIYGIDKCREITTLQDKMEDMKSNIMELATIIAEMSAQIENYEKQLDI